MLKGWREGLNKVGVTLLLRDSGVSLSGAYDATEGILQGRSEPVALPAGTDVETLRRELEKLGVITS